MGVLNNFFKFLDIKDISTKVIGSRNKNNIIRAAFIAMEKITGVKYEH